MSLDRLNHVIVAGIALREMIRDRGYNNLHEYYDECDALARDLPLDFKHDTGEWTITVEERAKIAKGPDGQQGTVVIVKKLKFTHNTKQKRR